MAQDEWNRNISELDQAGSLEENWQIVDIFVVCLLNYGWCGVDPIMVYSVTMIVKDIQDFLTVRVVYPVPTAVLMLVSKTTEG